MTGDSCPLTSFRLSNHLTHESSTWRTEGASDWVVQWRELCGYTCPHKYVGSFLYITLLRGCPRQRCGVHRMLCTLYTLHSTAATVCDVARQFKFIETVTMLPPSPWHVSWWVIHAMKMNKTGLFMEGGLRVLVAGLFNGGGLRVQVAGLFNGGRSEGASGWVVQWIEV